MRLKNAALMKVRTRVGKHRCCSRSASPPEIVAMGAGLPDELEHLTPVALLALVAITCITLAITNAGTDKMNREAKVTARSLNLYCRVAVHAPRRRR